MSNERLDEINEKIDKIVEIEDKITNKFGSFEIRRNDELVYRLNEDGTKSLSQSNGGNFTVTQSEFTDTLIELFKELGKFRE